MTNKSREHYPFSLSSSVYDAIYSHKDYQNEVLEVERISDPNGLGTSWLEVACGTGRHLQFLSPRYSRVVGVDLSSDMVRIAETRVPSAEFHAGDMRSLRLGEEFDVVSCLFGSIGYAATPSGLRQAIATLALHVKQGGVVVIEPWIFRHEFEAGKFHARFAETPELKVARMNTNRIEEDCAVLDFHHLVATSEGVEHYLESHVLGLFELADYEAAFALAGLQITQCGSDNRYLTGHRVQSGSEATPSQNSMKD